MKNSAFAYRFTIYDAGTTIASTHPLVMRLHRAASTASRVCIV
jgi:hypothetical protein